MSDVPEQPQTAEDDLEDPKRLVEALKKKSMLACASQLHDDMRKFRPRDRGRDNLTFLQRPYAKAAARQAVGKASVWFTAYMPSVLGRFDDAGIMESPIQTLADPTLWKEFRELGIKGLHTGPVMRSGGFQSAGALARDEKYDTIDGWFDPIELAIEEQLGSEEGYRQIVQAAANFPEVSAGDGPASASNGAPTGSGAAASGAAPAKLAQAHPDAIVIGDIVPGHTGMGADFHLALQAAERYPGLFVLARVDHILAGLDARHKELSADVIRDLCSIDPPPGEFSRPLKKHEVRALADAHIIPGTLQRSMGAQAGEGWSITKAMPGVSEVPGGPDRVTRRWVYLHFFHPKQPTLNWLDPSYSAWRMVTGQLNYMIWKLGSQAVRLDANAFLGIERRIHDTIVTGTSGDDEDAQPDTWSEAHPLSEMVTNMLAWQARRLGGFSFQEMNMSIPDVAKSQDLGPDLAYDFMTRPACEHALLTGNADLLRLMYSEMDRYSVDPVSLIHALQNHDEITYELVHLATRDQAADLQRDDHVHGYGDLRSFCKDDEPEDRESRREAREGRLTKCEFSSLWGRVRHEMREAALSNLYNRESPNGLCTTMTGLVAARLGIKSLEDLAAPPSGEEGADARRKRLDTRHRIQAGHLLLAAFNALQPGVFAVSGWDLVGALPVSQDRISPTLLNAGDQEKSAAEKDYRWVNRGAYRLISEFGKSSTETKGSADVYGPLSLPEAVALYGPIDAQRKEEGSFILQLRAILDARRELSLATGEFGGTLDLGKPELFGSLTWLGSDGTPDVNGTAALALFNFSTEPQAVDLKLASRTAWLTRWRTPTRRPSLDEEQRRDALLRAAVIFNALSNLEDRRQDVYRPSTRKGGQPWKPSEAEEAFSIALEPWGFKLFHLAPGSPSEV